MSDERDDQTVPPEALIQHLCGTGALSPDDARRLLREVLAYFDDTPESFIRRRHHELQKAGLANASIFPRIATELSQRRFAAPTLSERQIRRAIYG